MFWQQQHCHPAAEQKRLAAAKLETFLRINGLIQAASEQALGTKTGTMAYVN
ncbi:MAG TPA: hypothetical protein VJO16_15415 [Candidatus Acidoferrum sp.]|nr:hypothetical protein [Candidatus Acidoferrum sp.]